MKVIRYGVFETNSSSTHSVSLVFDPKEKENKKCLKYIKSPLYKVMFLKGLINFQFSYNHIKELPKSIDNFYNGCAKILSEELNIPLEKLEDYLVEKINEVDYEKQPYVKMQMRSGYSKEEAIAKFKSEFKIALTCENFFEDGCLDDCYCGFSSINCIERKLSLNSDDPLTPEKFMSNDYAFVLCEFYSGILPVIKNEKI